MSALPSLIRRLFCCLILFCSAGTWSAAQGGPWLKSRWEESMTIPPGWWQGPGKQIVVMNKHAVTWEPGSLVEKLDLKFEGEAKFQETEVR